MVITKRRELASINRKKNSVINKRVNVMSFVEEDTCILFKPKISQKSMNKAVL